MGVRSVVCVVSKRVAGCVLLGVQLGQARDEGGWRRLLLYPDYDEMKKRE